MLMPKSSFWQIWDPKRQSYSFYLDIGTHGITRMLILILALVSWNSNPKIHFWANLDQKFKAVYFVYKVALTVFEGCWFLFQHQFSEFPTLKFIFGQIWAKKSNRFWANSDQECQSCQFFVKIGTDGISRMQILSLDAEFSFLNF